MEDQDLQMINDTTRMEQDIAHGSTKETNRETDEVRSRDSTATKVERQQLNVLEMQGLNLNTQLDNTQVNLQNPKLYPLVVKYIGELREEWQKEI